MLELLFVVNELNKQKLFKIIILNVVIHMWFSSVMHVLIWVCLSIRPHSSSGLCSQQGRGWLPGSDPLYHEAFPPAGPFLLLLLLSHRLPLPGSQLAEALRHHCRLRPLAQQRPPQRLRQRPSRCTGWPGRVSVWVRSLWPRSVSCYHHHHHQGATPFNMAQRTRRAPAHMSVLCVCMCLCVCVCVSVWSSLEVQSNLICN